MTENDPSLPDRGQIQAWCQAASGGDIPALERLITAYRGRMMAFVRRRVGTDWQGKIDAEDVLQMALIDVCDDVKSFTFQDEDSFYRWSTRIIDHRFVDEVRRLRRKRRDVARETTPGAMTDSQFGGLLDRVLKDSVTASRIMRRDEAVQALTGCIARLPADYRKVIQRFHLQQESLAAIAAEMDRSEDAVRRLASRAVEKLAECLGRTSGYDSRMS